MKIKLKSLISFLALTFCFCLVIGAGYTVARYAGVFDVGSFNLTLESGVEPLYTIVYHTFNGSTDVVLSREDFYEDAEITIRGVPGSVSGDAYNYTSLSFFGWSPQGVWTTDEDSPFIKDTSSTENYVPDTRILYITGDVVALSALAEFSDSEIHLYDVYQNFRVSIAVPATSIYMAVDNTFMVKDANGNRLYDRVYLAREAITDRYTGPYASTGEKCNGYGIQENSYGADGSEKSDWYHYVHPGLTLYVFNNRRTGLQGLSGTYYVHTYVSYNGDSASQAKTVTMPNSSCTFSLKTEKEDDSGSSGSGGNNTCFASGTLITMADGTKLPVEMLSQGDMVRVFDHENGCYTASPILFTEYDGDKEWNVINLEFSDRTMQKFIYEHGLFDLDLNKYVYITEENYQDFIGHRFAKEEDAGYSEVVLTDAYTQVEFTGCYSLTTEYRLNVFVNGMFSMPGGITGLFNFFEYDENLAYDKELMAQDIETYGLFTYEDFAPYMSEETFNTIFPIKYLKVSIGKGLVTFEDLEYIIERYIYGHDLDS